MFSLIIVLSPQTYRSRENTYIVWQKKKSSFLQMTGVMSSFALKTHISSAPSHIFILIQPRFSCAWVLSHELAGNSSYTKAWKIQMLKPAQTVTPQKSFAHSLYHTHSFSETIHIPSLLNDFVIFLNERNNASQY